MRGSPLPCISSFRHPQLATPLLGTAASDRAPTHLAAGDRIHILGALRARDLLCIPELYFACSWRVGLGASSFSFRSPGPRGVAVSRACRRNTARSGRVIPVDASPLPSLP